MITGSSDSQGHLDPGIETDLIQSPPVSYSPDRMLQGYKKYHLVLSIKYSLLFELHYICDVSLHRKCYQHSLIH